MICPHCHSWLDRYYRIIMLEGDCIGLKFLMAILKQHIEAKVLFTGENSANNKLSP